MTNFWSAQVAGAAILLSTKIIIVDFYEKYW